MRVLHLTAGNLFGGIETYLLTLARLRHLCPDMEPEFGVCFPGRLQDELTAAGVRVHTLGPVRISRPWTVLRARRRLGEVLGEGRIDAVVTHGCWPHAVFGSVVKRAGLRLVYAVHGELNPRLWLSRWAAQTAPDAVVANSKFTATCVSAVFPRSPWSVVYPPVPPPDLLDRATVRTRLRSEFETPPDAVVILNVSRIEELKGHAVLFDALGCLQSVPDWVCWVVGGAQRPHEAELFRKLKMIGDRLGIAGRVRFAGSRSDVPAVMAAADLYCQPNTGPEGFGLTFVEALHAGLPVVTSGIGGATEVVTVECGVLCPPGDAEAVAKSLHGLIVDPGRRRKLGEAGPYRAAELCDPQRQLTALAKAIG